MVANPAAWTTEWWGGPAEPIYKPEEGDENRTRTLSLGICAVWAAMPTDLRATCTRVTVRDRSSPGLMAR